MFSSTSAMHPEPIFRLAGGIRVSKQEYSVPTGPLLRKLLAMILLHPGEMLAAERLIEELWPTNPSSSGLPAYIQKLRNAGFDIESYINVGYRLHGVSPNDVDALRFLANVQSLRLNPPDSLQEKVQAWTGVDSLLQGKMLDDILVGPETKRWILRVQAAQSGVKRELRRLRFLLGDHEEIIHELMAEWEQDHVREDIACLLIVALYRSVRRPEAIQVYRATEAAVSEQYGCEPMPQLSTIYQLMLRSDASLADPSQPIPGF